MELLYYLRLLCRRWVLLATSVFLALTVAAIMTVRTSPQYAASITLIVSAPDDGNAAAAYQAVLSSQERAKSYAKLIRSRSVTSEVARVLGNGVTPEELQQRITAEAVPGTILLRATVTDTSPALAMQIGHTLGIEFSRYVAGLEQPTPKNRPGVRISVADDADLPTAPVSPRPLVNLGLGLVIGLVIGTVIAVLRDLTDVSVRSVQSLREATGTAALGVIGLDRRFGEQRSPVVRDGSPLTEAFRRLRTNLRYARADGLPPSVVVTSAVSEEGKSMVACNLALSLAEAGWKVVLVDADLRGAGLSARLEIEGGAGLSSVLAADRPVGEVLQKWGPVSVLSSGPAARDASELLESSKMSSILRELEQEADIVVLDTPALLSTTDAAVLARSCTGTLLVTRHGKTRREDVLQAVEQLRTVRARLLGTVLSFAQPGGRTQAGNEMPRVPRPVDRRSLAAQR
jgi:capsular exopolysaccharide synthesis family protein